MTTPPVSRSIVCTLCEGSYWHGTAVLVNSLYANGFTGTVYVGYKGSIPRWFETSARTLLGPNAASGLPRLVYVPLATSRHMTNFKPDFLLWLAGEAGLGDDDAVMYFDPDIVNKGSWTFYERWVRSGIALCEDINSPMYSRNPIRLEWRRYFGLPEAVPASDPAAYFNAGFIGLQCRDLAFLRAWKNYQDLAETRGVNLQRLDQTRGTRSDMFYRVDQDFMNVAAMAYPERIAPMGKEGMDFVHGGQLMSHAIGPEKPWKTRYLGVVFKGRRPRAVDHQYWRHTRAPIRAHSRMRQQFARFELLIAGALGRLIA
jgi:hypothetical protein